MWAALAAADVEGVDLLVGPRGVAEALAQAITGIAEAKPVDVRQGKALFVIASRDPITVAQVETLRKGQALDYRPAPGGILQDRSRTRSLLTLAQVLPGEEEHAAEVALGIWRKASFRS